MNKLNNTDFISDRVNQPDKISTLAKQPDSISVILQEAQNTLKQKFANLTDKEIIISEKIGTVTVTGKKDNIQYTTVGKVLPNSGTCSVNSSVPLTPKKADQAETINILRARGLKQSEIAMRTGMSQSYVSKILSANTKLD